MAASRRRAGPSVDPSEVLEEEHCRLDAAVRDALAAHVAAQGWRECAVASIRQGAFLAFGWRCTSQLAHAHGTATRCLRLQLGLAAERGVQLEVVDECRWDEADEWEPQAVDRALVETLERVSGLPVCDAPEPV